MTDKVGRPIQESLLSLLINDEEHGALVSKLLSPEYFDGDYAEIATRVINFRQQYGHAPKRQVDDLFIDILEDKTGQGLTYLDLFSHLLEAFQDGLNTAFLVDQVNRFIRHQRLKSILLDSAEQLRTLGNEALEAVDKALDDYRRTTVDLSGKSLSLFEVDRVLSQLEVQGSEFGIGIRELDRGFIAPTRGTLFVIIGPTGAGKSWGLMHCAKRALLRRKRVLYVSCELSDFEVASRFYQMLLGVGRRSVDADVTRLMFDDETGKFMGFRRETVRADFSLFDEDKPTRIDPLAHTELVTRIRKLEWLFSNLRIRAYPSGKLTIPMLEAALDVEAAKDGFVADMVCLDYLGQMKVPGKPGDKDANRLGLGQIAVDLRGIADARNLAMVTAQQAGREGAKEQDKGGDVGLYHVASDWSLPGVADTAITLSQTKAEAVLGLRRLFVGKGRTERQGYSVLVTQNYAHGQFALDSYGIPNNYQRMIDEYLKAQESRGRGDDED